MKDPVSLAELARFLGVNKSKLNYYASVGLIKPVIKVSRTMIFERKDTLDRLAKIKKLQDAGNSLKKIAEEMK